MRKANNQSADLSAIRGKGTKMKSGIEILEVLIYASAD